MASAPGRNWAVALDSPSIAAIVGSVLSEDFRNYVESPLRIRSIVAHFRCSQINAQQVSVEPRAIFLLNQGLLVVSDL